MLFIKTSFLFIITIHTCILRGKQWRKVASTLIYENKYKKEREREGGIVLRVQQQGRNSCGDTMRRERKAGHFLQWWERLGFTALLWIWNGFGKHMAILAHRVRWKTVTLSDNERTERSPDWIMDGTYPPNTTGDRCFCSLILLPSLHLLVTRVPYCCFLFCVLVLIFLNSITILIIIVGTPTDFVFLETFQIKPIELKQ